jgi:hypothetical protein
MTDEQFKQLMDKLEEIKRAQQPNYVGYPAPNFMAPSPHLPRPVYVQPQPWQPYDGLPWHWRGGAVD